MEQESQIFTERQVIYGSFWERFAAVIIDGLILAIPNALITFLITGNIINSSGNFTVTLISGVLGWIYAAIMESGSGQATFGKRAMGLRVTGMNGERISFMNATGRHFGKILSAIILLIGYLMMLWSDKKQTLHDKMANTLVVKR
jgi:uncharacterized RDD family membrane protein YckC